MVEFDVADYVDYTQYSNRQLMLVPLAVLALALLVIGGWYATTGAPVNLGIEFTGGTELQLVAPGGEAAIRSAYTQPIASVQSVATAPNTYIVTFQLEGAEAASSEALVDIANSAGFTVEAVQSTSPSFGQGTQQLALIGVVAAFVGMSLLIFGIFRTAIPAGAVVFSAFSDIVIPLALMNILGIQLSLGTVAALLMLIGYSVDSDILLTTHVLRRSGGFYESTYRAMRTGVTMTLTSLSAVIVMALVATFFGIGLLSAMGTVLAFGLATDLMVTYLFNVSLLRWYRGVEA